MQVTNTLLNNALGPRTRVPIALLLLHLLCPRHSHVEKLNRVLGEIGLFLFGALVSVAGGSQKSASYPAKLRLFVMSKHSAIMHYEGMHGILKRG